VLIQPVEARSEICPSATYWIEMNGLSSEVRLRLLDFSVEVQDMHPLRSLAFED
jgi:hypothetical protein